MWGRLPFLSIFTGHLNFASFSSFSPHFNGMVSQRFLLSTAEHCISLTPLHTWFNFQLASDASKIIWLLWLLGVLDLPSFPPVPPIPCKAFPCGLIGRHSGFHPPPFLFVNAFYTICSELKVWAARRNNWQISVPTSAALRRVGSGLSGCRGGLSVGGFKNAGFSLNL